MMEDPALTVGEPLTDDKLRSLQLGKLGGLRDLRIRQSIRRAEWLIVILQRAPMFDTLSNRTIVLRSFNDVN
jgi:hypothetical protein